MNALAETRRAGEPDGPMPAASGERRQYLSFMLGGETFAIGILYVREIIEYGGLTEVPMMPASVRGVINLRGAVVPVMDLAARFGRQSQDVGKRTCIVIVEVDNGQEQQVIGVVVDAVNAVIEIAATDIEPAPAFGARIQAEFIGGMAKHMERFIIILNVDDVLQLDAGELSGLADAGDAAMASAGLPVIASGA